MFRLPFRWLALALLTLAAFWLRTHDLARRPMHADEANQAVKLGELIDAGRYAFDPRDHHGPTLYYAALPVAWLRGEHSLATLTETTVRLVPAVFGTLTVVLVALLATCGQALGSAARGSATSGPNAPPSWEALAAAALVAVAPPAVYYSRYFIQETLLVTFTLAAFLGVRTWWRTGLTRWAVATGVCVGLAQATKASAPLFLAAGLLALWAAQGGGPRPRRLWRDAVIALLAAVFTAATLYTSFGTHFAGLRDALGVYTHAVTRFGAESAPTGHEKPWWYYLRIFGWHREGGLLWHQAAFSVLAVAGTVIAFIQRETFRRGVAVYALVVTAMFSMFAYKTPWHTVHLVPAYALLAVASLAAIARLRTGRPVAVAFALITFATLFQQTWRTSFLRPADQRNPYAYVHSSPDVLKYRALAEEARRHAPGQPIRVISEEYWPLPWYLRGLPDVGYYSAPPTECDGALIIAAASQAEAVRSHLRRNYRESLLGLRPGFLCVVFIRDEGNEAASKKQVLGKSRTPVAPGPPGPVFINATPRPEVAALPYSMPIEGIRPRPPS